MEWVNPAGRRVPDSVLLWAASYRLSVLTLDIRTGQRRPNLEWKVKPF